MVVRWRSFLGMDERQDWRPFCEALGGVWVEPQGWTATGMIQVSEGEAILTLDTVAGETGESGRLNTRVRALFVNRDHVSFRIRRSHTFTHWNGPPDQWVSVPALDRAYLIQGAEQQRIRTLCTDRAVREGLLALRSVRLRYFATVGSNPAISINLPPGVDELRLSVRGLVLETAVLERMIALTGATLAQILRMESRPEDPVERESQVLLGPGGKVREAGIVLWDGDPPRRRAADALGGYRDRRALPARIRTLSAADVELRARSAWALGEIGDGSALGHLIPLLGWENAARGLSQPGRVAEAVTKLGAGQVVHEFRAALRRPLPDADSFPPDHREAVLAAFAAVLIQSVPEEAANAARALQVLGGVEHRTELEQAARHWRGRDRAVHDCIRTVLFRLQDRSRLPRPTAAPTPDPKHLPLPGTEEAQASD